MVLMPQHRLRPSMLRSAGTVEATTCLTSALDLEIKAGLIKLISATLPGVALMVHRATRRVLMASLLSLIRMAFMSSIRDDGMSNTPPLPRMKLHLVEPHPHLHLNLDLARTWLPVLQHFALLYAALLQPAPDSLGCVSSTFIPTCSLLNTVPLGFTFCPGFRSTCNYICISIFAFLLITITLSVSFYVAWGELTSTYFPLPCSGSGSASFSRASPFTSG